MTARPPDRPAVVILDIPLAPARPRPAAPVRPAESPPAPDGPAVRPAPAVQVPVAAPGLGYEEPTIEWRSIGPRPPASRTPARAVPAGRHLAVVGTAAAGLGIAGFLAGLLSSTAPFVVFGWAASGTIVLLVVVRVGRWIGDAIGGGSR